MFDPEEFIEKQAEDLAAEVDGKAIIGVSGGVDSMVAAILMDRGIGERLFAV